jgi:Flp pilus assembly pilin Flp
VRLLLHRLLRDESGQDIIEYVLLTAALGLGSAAAWPLISAAIGVSYRQLDTNTQGLWVPPNPGAGS